MSNDASTPALGRKIVIDPVTRIEGHGKVTIQLDANGRVEQARFHVVEFRGFERFIRGRFYWEVPIVIQRLCGICPVSHHLCAAKAMDMVVGVDKVSPTADKMRRLMHYGQILQSNAVHFFHLASPDLLFGFDAPAAKRNIVGLVAEYPELAKRAILIRKYGQEVIKATGGKKVHATSAVPGGFNQNLSIESRDALIGELGHISEWVADSLELYKRLAKADWARHLSFATTPSNYVSLVGNDGELDLYDGYLRATDAAGKKIFDGVKASEYREVLAEESRSWSYAKFPHIKSLGKEAGWYRVGPLAVLNNCEFIPTPLAERERQVYLAAGWGKPVHSTLAYHWARIICMVHASEMIEQLLADPDLLGTDLMRTGSRREEGVAWIEAPRGTLFHHYRVDGNDQVMSANLIVSSTNNNEAMNRAVRKVADDYLSGNEITEGLLNHVEVALRAYDPCLSCATHALGRMPLEVTLLDHSGAVIDLKVRA